MRTENNYWVDPDGSQNEETRWIDHLGFFHREDGPARIVETRQFYPSGRSATFTRYEWRLHGVSLCKADHDRLVSMLLEDRVIELVKLHPTDCKHLVQYLNNEPLKRSLLASVNFI